MLSPEYTSHLLESLATKVNIIKSQLIERKKESLVQIHTSLEWGLLHYVTRYFEFENYKTLVKWDDNEW